MQPDSPVQKFKAIIAYDGTDFLGFQIQAQGRTVQGTLEEALRSITTEHIRVTGSGRTDAGVHATGQVIAFNLAWKHSPAKLLNAINAYLPPDVMVSQLEPAAPEFHPRFDALSREYRYTILNQPMKDILRQRYTMHVVKPLNVSKMQQASLTLVGAHNFASFGKPPQGDNTVRTLMKADWQQRESEITFHIEANAFLYRMVRNIVGTLLLVGLEEINIEAVNHILQAKDRSQSGAPALASGLSLVNVNY